MALKGLVIEFLENLGVSSMDYSISFYLVFLQVKISTCFELVGEVRTAGRVPEGSIRDK